jgi:hypothetical protein
LGDILGQREGQISYTIYFVNKNLSPTEVNYTVTEKEFLSVVHAINKFRHYIIGFGIGETQGSTLQQRSNKTVTISPFGKTYEVDEVSPEVEVGVVEGLKCLQHSWDTDM